MINRRLNGEEQNRKALLPIKKVLIGFVCVILIFVIILFFYPKPIPIKQRSVLCLKFLLNHTQFSLSFLRKMVGNILELQEIIFK